MTDNGFRVVDRGWPAEFKDALRADRSALRIVCPFIKTTALARLLSPAPGSIKVLTRFSLDDFASGVSDIGALRNLISAGACVRGIRNLHAKLYLFGESRAIITSANLTGGGLLRNPEFGVVAENRTAIESCLAYFEDLWTLGNPLRSGQVDEWEQRIGSARSPTSRSNCAVRLPDYGADAGFTPCPQPEAALVYADPPQAIVKFIGGSSNRMPSTEDTLVVIESSNCHRVLAYPKNRRPRSVKEGAIMFIARFTSEPDDIRIFGRAIARKYVEGRDDAGPSEIGHRDWLSRFPRFIRVRDAKFLSGSMKNGLSLKQLMHELGSDSFPSTQRKASSGQNTDPSRAYRQQSFVELTGESYAWLNQRLEQAFRRHGAMSSDSLDRVDSFVEDEPSDASASQ